MDIRDKNEPELVTLWTTLNKTLFQNRLKQPRSLRYQFDLKKSGGYFRPFQYKTATIEDYTCEIIVRGQIQNHPNEVEQIMAHEMTHQFSYEEWLVYGRCIGIEFADFVYDKSAFFKYQLSKVADKMFTTYNDLAWYDSKYVDDNSKHITQSMYEAPSLADFLKGNLK